MLATAEPGVHHYNHIKLAMATVVVVVVVVAAVAAVAAAVAAVATVQWAHARALLQTISHGVGRCRFVAVTS